jgi:ribosomal protein S5
MFDSVVPEPVVTPVPTVWPPTVKFTVPGTLVVAVNVTVCPATAGLGAAVTLVVVAVVANAALLESKGASSATELTSETVRTNLDKLMSEVCPRRNT